MENEKNSITFSKVLVIISVVLLMVCIFYWVKLSNFIDEFEKTLTIEAQTVEDISTEDTLPVEVDNSDDSDTLHTPIVGEESEIFMDLTLEVAESYAKFTSADLDFRDIKGYFLEGSEILELLETYNSNRYNSHEKSYFENIDISQPFLTGEQTIKCQVSFDYIVVTSENTHTYPSSYTVYFDRDSKKVTSLEMS